MKPTSKKDLPYIVKVNSREQAKNVIEKLIELGFKSDKRWNDNELKDIYYNNFPNNIYIHLGNYRDSNIQIHTRNNNSAFILFDEWQNLTEYDPKDVAFKNDVYSNSEFNSQSKVIGYKLIKEEYKRAVREVLRSVDSDWFDKAFEYNLIHKGYNFVICEKFNSINWQLKKAGVMHWFEAVYQDESITLKSGKFLTASEIEEVKEILNNENRNNNLI